MQGCPVCFFAHYKYYIECYEWINFIWHFSEDIHIIIIILFVWFKDLKADDPEINDAIHATYYDKNSICGCRTICIVHIM